MKRRNLWILLAALAVVGILVFALLGLQGGKDGNDPKPSDEAAAAKDAEPEDGEPESGKPEESTPAPEPTPVDPELPLDDSPLTPGSEGSTEEPPAGEETGDPEPGEDPGEDEPINLDEDELPIYP